VIRCFFDDSGKESERGNRIVSIAGYLAGGETYWDLFGTGWSHQLFRHGISWLHMKDFMQDRDEYAAFKWDWPKKRSVLEDFIKVIKVSQIIGFGVALDAEAWRKVPKQFTAVEGTAQEFCFLRIMRMIVERMKIVRPNDYVSVFFDCDKGFTPARFQKFIGFRDHDPEAKRYFQSFSIAEPKLYLPLQAADLLAWETRKELIRKLGGLESRPEFTYIFEALPGSFPDYTGEFWDETEIERKIIKPFLEKKKREPREPKSAA